MRVPVLDEETLCVGLGNVFRSDDGVGPYIVNQLAKRCPGVPWHVCRDEGMDLIVRWQPYRTVVVFDAVASTDPAGTVHAFQIPPDTLPATVFACSTHAFNLVDVIRLAENLGQLPQHVWVYGIAGRSFVMGKDLSPEVRRAADQLVQCLEENNA